MRRAWDVMMVGLLVYTAIYVPYQIAFLSSDLEPIRDDGLFAWGIIVDTIFMSDMLLALVTGYVDGGELVMEHDAISYNYIKSWFLIDFVGSVPIDIIIDGFAQGVDGVVTGDAAQDVSLLQILRTGKYFKLIRMIRILRLAKLDRHVQQIEVLLRVNP
jgi:hyperpolarization activated cyclic nucleotide-gated potassium channel 1